MKKIMYLLISLFLSSQIFAQTPNEIAGPLGYCQSQGDFPWHEWIAQIKIADLDHTSFKSPYSDFTQQIANVTAGQTYPISLTTGFSYDTWDEYWSIWIDFNQDGDFIDDGEKVFSQVAAAPPAGTPTNVYNAFLNIPFDAPAVQTRMRIAMKRGAFATPCETFPFGEVEDYTINISSGQGLAELSLPSTEVIPGGNFLCFTAPGQSFGFFGGIILNSGTEIAEAFKLRAYFSKDNQISADDVLWDEFSYADLNPNDVESFAFTAAVPASLPPGDYFILAHIDPDNQVQELNESNNIAVFRTQIGAPDYSTSSLSAMPAEVDAGDFISLSAVVQNNNPYPLNELSGELAVKVYLSTDNVFSSFSDQEIGTTTVAYDEFSNAPLFENGTALVNLTATIPVNIPEGDYYLFVSPARTCETNVINNPSNAVLIKVKNETPGVYCDSYSNFPWHDWIAGIQLANLNHSSLKSQYADFTALTANLSKGTANPISLTTGFSYITWDEYWRIWIDFNKDGDFTDAGETVFSGVLNAPANGTPEATLTSSLFIPASAPSGTARMRVSMKRGGFASSCEVLDFGEVEDYSVNISDLFSESNQRSAQVYFQASRNKSQVDLFGNFYYPEGVTQMDLEKSLDGVSFEILETISGSAKADAIETLRLVDPNPQEGDNHYRVRLSLEDGQVVYSLIETITYETPLAFRVFPNPVSIQSEVFVQLEEMPEQELQWMISDAFGREVAFQKTGASGADLFRLEVQHTLQPGLYYLHLIREGRRAESRRFVVIGL